MSNRFKTVVSVWMVFSIADSLHHHYDSTLDDSVRVLEVEQQNLDERMSLYEDLASPKTVQLYIAELHKILDEIYFLDQLVQSGQISAEALDGYFDTYDVRLDELNKKMLDITGNLKQLAKWSENQGHDLDEFIDESEERVAQLESMLVKNRKESDKTTKKMLKSLANIEKIIDNPKFKKLFHTHK